MRDATTTRRITGADLDRADEWASEVPESSEVRALAAMARDEHPELRSACPEEWARLMVAVRDLARAAGRERDRRQGEYEMMERAYEAQKDVK